MDGHLLRFSKDMKYVLLDLETFNLCLNFQYNRPWQVGILQVVGETVVNSLDIRVKWPDAPHLKIGKEAAIITRFNEQEHNRLAVLPEVALEKFWPVLDWADAIIMHNGLKFDLYLLRGYARMFGKPWDFITQKVIDTKSIAQGYKMSTPYNPKDNFMEYQYRMANIHAHGVKTSLKSLAPEFNIPYDPNLAHDAIYDLKVNLAAWNKLKYFIEI
jgi:DNA polymerase III epsilon subunit-like protein